MGSYEIVEDKDVATKHNRPCLDSMEYHDIDKLFKSLTLRGGVMGSSSFHHLETSASAGPSRSTSPSKKNALRKSLPTRSPRVVGGLPPPSDSVSLKQALRDLCISKASEIAAQKRLTKSAAASPRVSVADRMIKSLYSQVLNESGLPVDKGKRSLVDIDIPSSSLSVNVLEPSEMLLSTSDKSGSFLGSSGGGYEIDEVATSSHVVIEDELVEIDKHVTSLPLCSKELDKSIVSSGGLNSEPTALDSGLKGKLVSKVTRTIPRPKKKILLKKKLKIVVTTRTVEEVDDPLEPNASQVLCRKCHCAVENTANENNHPPLTEECSNGLKLDKEADNDTSGSCEVSNIREADIVTKQDVSQSEKFEFSLSSKDSLGDYTSSTSMSEESILSRFSCGNKPHMSMDVRWEAIKHVKLQYGSLGLRQFNLLKKLGCGDIGTVYLAELIGTNCLFAIKVMDIEFLARRKKTPRAQAERAILKMLDHPFLPTLYAQFVSDNLSCLVMEYCPGGDLHVLRQKQLSRCFPEPAARFYVAEVLLALEYLHMLGVIYRDLKPENILVREDGHIMLTDFDLSLRCAVNPTLLRATSPPGKDQARMSGHCVQPLCIEPSCFSPRLRKPKRPVDLLTQQFKSLPQLIAEPTEARSNSFVGTHEYLAPEIIKGEGHGAAVDWWTFGVLLYELLYGKTPFKGYDNEETLSNVVYQSLEFPDSPLVGFGAKELIRKLLVKDPERRLGSEKGAAEIKRHPFFEGLNWALIRCAIPPELPDVGAAETASSPDGNNEYLECKAIGDHLEFELF